MRQVRIHGCTYCSIMACQRSKAFNDICKLVTNISDLSCIIDLQEIRHPGKQLASWHGLVVTLLQRCFVCQLCLDIVR